MTLPTGKQDERVFLVIAAVAAAATLLVWQTSGSATLFLIMRWLVLLTLVAYASFRRTLTAWIFVAMLLGAEIGHDLPNVATNLRVLAMIFLRLILTNLGRHRIRTLISVAGIAFSVAAMLTVVTILQGAVGMFSGLLSRDSELIVFERNIYDLFYAKPSPPVRRKDCFEVVERLGADGSVETRLDEAKVRSALIPALKTGGYRAIALCLLNAYANPVHEQRLAQLITEALPGVLVTASHQVAREFREFERASTTLLSAYVQPVIDGYLHRFESKLANNKADVERSEARDQARGVVATVTDSPFGQWAKEKFDN